MLTSSPPRAAAYARVSTAAQAGTDPWASLPQQTLALQDMAKRLGFGVTLPIEEQGSGAKADRPGWLRVLAAARAGEVDVIMAVAFDRLTRSSKMGEFEELAAELGRIGVRVVTLKEGELNLSGSADAQVMNGMRALWAMGERLKTRERTMTGRRASALAGKHVGGNAPYGYRKEFDREGKRLFVVDEARAAVVRELFDRAGQGARLSELARWLTAADIPPLLDAKGDPSHHWTPTHAKNALTCPLYGGWSNYHRGEANAPKVRSQDFEALVSEDAWELAQEAIGLLAFRGARGPHQPRPLSGILRCASCGAGMGFLRVRSKASSTDIYSCPKRSATLHATPCPSPQYLNLSTAHATVLAYLREHLPGHFHRQLDPGALEAHEKAKKAPARRDDTAALERQRQALEAKQAKVGSRLALEDDPDVLAGLRGALKEVAAELAAVEIALGNARQQAVKVANTKAVTRSMAAKVPLLDRVELADHETLRLVFDTFLARVTLEKVSAPQKRQVLRVATCELRDGESL